MMTLGAKKIAIAAQIVVVSAARLIVSRKLSSPLPAVEYGG
jgi:hypothetical protein